MEIRLYPHDVCEFCSGDNPTWSYPARDCQISPAGEPLPLDSIGAWLACDECAALIERQDWVGLARRSVTTNPLLRGAVADLGKEVALNAAMYGHQVFRANRTGQPQRYETPSEHPKNS